MLSFFFHYSFPSTFFLPNFLSFSFFVLFYTLCWLVKYLFSLLPLSPLLQVLKPLSEHYMEDNVRQTVVNSLKASLTEQGSQHTKLKTHWRSSSPPRRVHQPPARSLNVLNPRTVELVQHQSCPYSTSQTCIITSLPFSLWPTSSSPPSASEQKLHVLLRSEQRSRRHLLPKHHLEGLLSSPVCHAVMDVSQVVMHEIQPVVGPTHFRI